MFSTALVLFGVLACFQNGESQLTWTTPTINAATGSGAFTAVAEQGGSGSVTALTGLTVTAVSSSQNIISHVVEQNSFGIFSMTGSTTGQLNLLANKALDYEFAASHIITIKAVDDTTGTALSGTATMTVSVTDVTAADPTWPSFHYCVVLADSAAAATSLTTITAPLSSGTGTLVYALEPTTPFEISSSGEIKVSSGQTINRAVTRSYQLTVTAGVASALTSSTIVDVCVGSSTQCGGCGASAGSGAAAITINIMAIVSILLLLVVKS